MRFLLLAWYNQSITLLLLSLRSSVRTSAIQASLIALGLSSVVNYQLSIVIGELSE